MTIPLLGQHGGTPFDRTFFNVRLEQILARLNSAHARVNVYLSDGTTLGLCHIDEMTDEFLTVRAYGDEPACALAMHLIPYSLIYRMEIDPNPGDEPRLGFHRRHTAI